MTTPPIATTASTPAPAASALFLFGDGFEEGCLPDFRATTAAQAAEEARIASVAMSRARHGWSSPSPAPSPNSPVGRGSANRPACSGISRASGRVNLSSGPLPGQTGQIP
jgi:hypothetical protein